MDHLTKMLIDELIRLLDDEPPQDVEEHPSTELRARVGAAWAEWDRQVAGIRTVLGVRLVNAATTKLRSER